MTLTTIRSEVRRLLGGITTTEYSDADLDQAVSNYYHAFIIEAMNAGGEWQVQGEVATTNIVASQAEYVLPTDLLQLHRIEVNTTGNTNDWDVAKIVDMRSKPKALSNSATAAFGAPEIRVFDESLFFVDTPSANSTAGLKIYFSDDPAELTTSTEPRFVEGLHVGLVYGACFDFVVTKNLADEIQTFKALLDEKLSQLREHYAKRLPAKRTRLRPRGEVYY